MPLRARGWEPVGQRAKSGFTCADRQYGIVFCLKGTRKLITALSRERRERENLYARVDDKCCLRK
jgi:hypothetical protein